MTKTEIHPCMARLCMRPHININTTDNDNQQHTRGLCAALYTMVTNRLLAKLLHVNDWGQVVSSALRFEFLAYQLFWIESVGFTIPKTPAETFSPLKLLASFIKKKKQQSEAEWRRPLMTVWVVEGKHTRGLTPLTINLSEGDSQAFWAQTMRQHLAMPTFPTDVQVEELKEVMRILREKHEGCLGPVLEEAAAFAECAGGKSANRVLLFVVAAEAIQHLREQGASGNAGHEPQDQDQERARLEEGLCTLMSEPRAIIGTLALYNGIAVARLKDSSDWKLSMTIPALVRRVLLRALAGMSWRRLLTIVKPQQAGLWKAISRTVHLGAILKKAIHKAIRKSEKGDEAAAEEMRALQRVCLVHTLLHESRYPGEAEGKHAWTQWCVWVVEPLEELLRDPLFDLAVPDVQAQALWLSRRRVSALAGHTVPSIVAHTVETELARKGNRRRTWDGLLAAGQLTLQQLLANVRTMALLGVPASVVVGQIRRRLKADAEQQLAEEGTTVKQHWGAIMKAIIALRGALGSAELDTLGKQLQLHRGKEDAPDLDADANEPRVQVRVTVKDKKGATHEIVRHKRVAALFADPTTATSHVHSWTDRGQNGGGLLCALDEAIEAQVMLQTRRRMSLAAPMNPATSTVEEPVPETEEEVQAKVRARRARTLALLVYTPEMCDAVRVGMPPEIPQYSQVALWRGESVCLQRLIGRLETPDEQLRLDRAREAKQHAAIVAMSGGGHAAAVEQADVEMAEAASRDSYVRDVVEMENAKMEVDPRGPPPTPPASDTTMGMALQGVLVGISWCQEKGSARSVDLDLSLLLFDECFGFIAHCSYQNLRLPGATHSGDLMSAPYPHGSRETVELDLPALRRAHPTCRYCALAVYAYTGQSMDDLYDASVFVANPNSSGDGPGGIDILTAAKLTGQGTTNLAAYVEIELTDADPSPHQGDQWMHGVRYHFVNCDQTLNVRHANATGSSGTIAEALRRVVQTGPRPAKAVPIVEDSQKDDDVTSTRSSASLRLRDAATLMAATTADRVLVLHDAPVNGGSPSSTLLERREGESAVQLMQRIAETLADPLKCIPALEPRPTVLSASAWKWDEDPEVVKPSLLVLGGELENWTAIEREFGRGGWVDELRMVNLRSHAKTADRTTQLPNEAVEGEGDRSGATMIKGWETLHHVL